MFEYTKNNPLKCFFAFAGYDSQAMALQRLKEKNNDFDFTCVGWSEIDDAAIRAHNLCFPEYQDLNYGDISKIDWNNVPDFDFFTYSFPCTNISLAGKQEGLEEGSGTASSLLWECGKAIIVKKPKFLLMENVKNLISKKYKASFDKWLDFLQEQGYKNYYKVINASDCNVPQNRERIFCVSILDSEKPYSFPQPEPLVKKISTDIIEHNVDKRYYKKEGIDYEILPDDTGIVYKGLTFYENQSIGIFDSPKFRKKGLFEKSRTLRASNIGSGFVYRENGKLVARRFTPKERLRLMDVPQKYVDILMNSDICETKIYRLTGNSIVVACLEKIMENLFN